MQITTRFNYRRNEIPYRCRKPRDVEYADGHAICEIPEISSDQAPVAIVTHDWGHVKEYVAEPTAKQIELANAGEVDMEGEVRWQYGWYRPYLREKGVEGERCVTRGDFRIVTVEMRWWDGKLWTHYRGGYASGEPGSPLGKPGEDPRATWNHHSARPPEWQEAQDKIANYYAQFVIIDGQTYRLTPEPLYEIHTFGLGMNHGVGWGTSISLAKGYNPNIGHDRYFTLLQREQAIEEATRIALARGDTKAIPMADHTPQVDVLIPEAIQRNPGVEYAGDGDDFTNKAESIVQGAQSPAIAGLLVMALATLP